MSVSTAVWCSRIDVMQLAAKNQRKMTIWRMAVIWLCSLLAVLSAALDYDDIPPSPYHGPIVMGVSNNNCDNAEVSLLATRCTWNSYLYFNVLICAFKLSTCRQERKETRRLTEDRHQYPSVCRSILLCVIIRGHIMQLYPPHLLLIPDSRNCRMSGEGQLERHQLGALARVIRWPSSYTERS